MRKVCVLLAVLAVTFLVSCGGGGGGDSSPAVTPVVTPGVEQLTCPDGSKVPSTSGVRACPAVALLAGSTAYTNVDPRTLTHGIVAQFNGAINPTSVTAGNVVLTHGTATVPGAVSLAANNMDLAYAPTQWLAYGQTYSLAADIDDSVGRSVQVIVPITTAAMSCTNTKIWSTPALFSTAYQNCVAGIGVQTQVTPTYNTLQDDTCVITAGAPLTAACKAYLANGTMVLANTGVTANGHATMWMSYIATNASSAMTLLDTSNQGSPVPIATFAPASKVSWFIGNPGGAFIHTVDGKGSQLTVNENSQIVSTCLVNCP